MPEKRTTSREVAQYAGVSRSVVSAVINGTPGIGVGPDTREKVLKAIKELNYHVDAQARGLKTGFSRTVAVYGDMKNPLFLQLLEGVQKACSEEGYHVLINGKSGEEEDRFAMLDLIRQRRVDGIISLDDTAYASPEWAERVLAANAPFVSVEGYADVPEVASILTDYRGSIRAALDDMETARGGITQDSCPVYLDAYLDRPVANWAERDRREAYSEWCADRGFTPVIHSVNALDIDWIAGFLTDLQERNPILPPLLINWSVAAVSVYRAAYRLGIRIGKDLQLMAGDDTNRSNAFMIPALGCVEIPYAAMGEKAVRVLLEQLNDPAYHPGKLWLQATVVRRESVSTKESG